MEKENFDELVKNLKHWNESKEGIQTHITDSPIFTVQERVKITGMDSTYCDDWMLYFDGDSWDDVEEYTDTFDDEELKNILKISGCDDRDEFLDLDEYEQIEALKSDASDLEQIYYTEEWKHINTHLTREGAERFINRKSHDHNKLRIYVESLYWCPEFKELIKGLVSGKIILSN